MTINLKALNSVSWQREGARTAILEKAGFQPPQEHAAIAERLARLEGMSEPVTARLVEAVVTGEGDAEQLRAGALAEVGGNVHRLNDLVRNGVERAQGRIVREVAAETYKAVQSSFNAAATAFAKAVAAADPETPAEDIISQGDLKIQKAWQDAAQHSAELDRLLVPVLAAAANAGLPHPAGADTSAVAGRSPKTKSMVLGLVVDATGVENIRDVWTALDAEGRTGAWGALLRVGAKIGAKNLDSYEPLRQPAQLVDRKVERGDGTYTWVTVDPELEETAATAE
ncbi:hypothetical protein [Mycolicibacterium sp. GESEQ-9]|uniref:hypothetical protein n=1 Tax=Mycolicibacterium sp. GESEQ-9 TaxID=2812656 RepID=UPI001B3433C4|nr:hypothetical protein [Mycolicibacterium sp. GESEQ-9]